MKDSKVERCGVHLLNPAKDPPLKHEIQSEDDMYIGAFNVRSPTSDLVLCGVWIN
jgi:hypothetical protein